MQLKTAISAALFAATLAIGGTAMADTTLNTTTGDVFLNIVNTTNNTSFLYDTGLPQVAFTGTANLTYSLAGNANYQAFVAAAGGSLTGAGIDYSVISDTNNPTGPVVDFTTNSTPAMSPAVNAVSVAAAQANIAAFMQGADANNTATTKVLGSAILGGAYEYGTALNEGQFEATLLTANQVDNAAVNTALNFYTTSAGAGRVATYNGVTKEAGQWDLSSAGVLTYSVSGGTKPPPVPLPTPILLLLSGLGFMGVVARRNKAV